MLLRCTALVIGGGPAGATAARYLARAGVDTILVERDLSYVKPCGGGIPSGGFNEFDLPESLIRKKISNIAIISPSDRRTEISLKGGYLCITERGTFDNELRNLAISEGAHLIEGSFTGLEAETPVFVANVKRRDTGENIQIRSDYILAADGISFRSGRCCGLNNYRRLYTISAQLRGQSGDTCEFWFGNSHASNFYSWSFPSHGFTSIGTGACNASDLKGLFNNFIRRKYGPEAEQFSDSDTFQQRIFPVPEWRGGPYRRGNMLFAGDAAGMVMPTTYEGIYYAMKSGYFAAQAISENRPAQYERFVKDRFRNRFILMNLFRRIFFRTDNSIEKWIRIHNSPVVQEVAMRLWLQKESGSANLLAYMRAFSRQFVA